MKVPKKPQRTLRSDLRRLRKRLVELAKRGGKSSGKGLKGARAQIGPALATMRELVGRGAVFAVAFLRRAARAARTALFAAAAAVIALARRIGRTVRSAASAVIGTASRTVTPTRALAVVTLAAAVLLAASQFTHYTGVTAGTPQYAGLENEAPAPVVQVSDAGSAHGWALLGIAVVAVLALIVALRGRWQLARLISLAGLAGLGVALLIDLPKGLREGEAGIAFAGAHAKLLDGFYIEVAASAVLALCGMLLARHLGASAPPKRRRRRRRPVPAKPGLAGGGT